VAVTNDGTPEIVRFTVPVNPLIPVTVTVSEPLELRFTVIAAGAEMMKSAVGTASTTRVTEIECDVSASVPVIVNGYVPGGVLALVVIESVVLPEAVSEAGLKVGVAPLGRPDTVKLTVP